ncbi:hypothetical protein TSUD_354320 [Trifolium subterraneum]|uniref:Uncharacterized protein n=1 Tax=Trifolium subterraneum TaxID=3900 RepID=A0A2Z6MRG5_TRISU|nr:hypothetical protein TSUD_354320 [Trifolium subterraneum]
MHATSTRCRSAISFLTHQRSKESALVPFLQRYYASSRVVHFHLWQYLYSPATTDRVHHLNHGVWKHERNQLITHKLQQRIRIKLKALDWIIQLAQTCFWVEEVAAGSTNAIQK